MRLVNIFHVLILCSLGTIALPVAAETVTFTTIDQQRDFQKYWHLSDDEIERYKKFMRNEGKFRYPRLTPLEVLAISAPDDATMRYYAKKAAADEMRAVNAQLKYAVMVTEEKTKIWRQEQIRHDVGKQKKGIKKEKNTKLHENIKENSDDEKKVKPDTEEGRK